MSIVLPAEPRENAHSPGLTAPGRNVSSCDEIAAPVISAPQILAAASAAVRCWRSRSGLSLSPRIFSIRNGWPVTIYSRSEVRRICPPPFPMEPSIRIAGSRVDMGCSNRLSCRGP